MERRGTTLTALAIFFGLTLGAYLLGKSFERFRTDDRFISVKGFAEREVKADLVIWSFKIRITTNDLQEGNASLETAVKKVNDFLVKNGINAKEITQQSLAVTDKQANEYGGQNGNERYRYIIQQTIEVRSANVDAVQRVSRMTSELLSAGVALSTGADYGNGLRFIFTKLNDIKPAMLSEATKNARTAAEEFTKESQTHLGKMRKASQGLFSILDRDESLAGGGEGGYYASGTSDLFKKIRVVISVEYAID